MPYPILGTRQLPIKHCSKRMCTPICKYVPFHIHMYVGICVDPGMAHIHLYICTLVCLPGLLCTPYFHVCVYKVNITAPVYCDMSGSTVQL